MKRYIRVFLLTILVMFGLINNSEAADIASSFEFPVPNYSVTGYDFGDTVYSTVLHLGEDATAAPLDPIYASANGRILPSPITGWHESYGYVVVIEHELSDGDIVYSVSGHMRSQGLMTSGDVIQGDVIGYAGYDDENGDGGPHLHFGIYHGSYSGSWVFYGRGSSTNNWYDPTDFISDHQIDCSTYTSEFSAIKSSFGSMIGNKDGSPYLYDGICAQDYDASGTSDGTSAILFDASGEANQAYLVRSGFWNHYDNVCSGPEGDCSDSAEVNQCGPPIGDEYYNGINTETGYGTARQDFQTCYLYWNGSVASSEFYPEVAPGWFDGASVWQGAISYAFAEAYETNYSRNDMGEAVEQFGNPAGVHHWGDDSSLPYVQDFDGGTYGWSVLMYNEDLEAAFAIHTGFWEAYRDDGSGTYGPPCSDEYEGSDGYTYQEFPSYLFQWKNNRTIVYDKNDDDCSDFSISSTASGLTQVIDQSTWDYTSQVPTNLAAVDLADLSSSVTCAVDAADSLYVVLNGQDGRIYEFESTNDGVTWTSTGLTNIAAVPLSAPGTTPHLFIDPDTGDRYVTFMGVNSRINLFHYNGTSWTAVELTSVVAAPLADLTSSPYGYIANGIVYVVFQGDDQRIWRFSITNGTSYGSLDLTGQAAVEYAMPGTSPQAVYNDLTGEHHIVFQGVNQRIQRLTYNGSTWSSVEITSVVNSDLLDTASSPYTYVDPFTGYVYTVINGVNERIDLIADYHNNSWGSDELTSIVSVPLTEPGTSPTGYIDPFTGNHVITFQGDDRRINQFEGSSWTSIDLTSQASVEYAASGTSPGTCVDPFSGVRHMVFVGDNGRVQYLRYGP